MDTCVRDPVLWTRHTAQQTVAGGALPYSHSLYAVQRTSLEHRIKSSIQKFIRSETRSNELMTVVIMLSRLEACALAANAATATVALCVARPNIVIYGAHGRLGPDAQWYGRHAPADSHSRVAQPRSGSAELVLPQGSRKLHCDEVVHTPK